VPEEKEVAELLDRMAETMRDEVLDGVAQEFLSTDRSLGVSGSNRAAREFIKAKEASHGLLGTVSGKAVLRKLFSWTQEEFGVSLSAFAVASHMRAADIAPEMRSIVVAIENHGAFPEQRFVGLDVSDADGS